MNTQEERTATPRLYTFPFPSPVGTLIISSTDTLITGITLVRDEKKIYTENRYPAIPLLGQAISQLSEYFSGTRQLFELPLDFTQTWLPQNSSRGNRPSAFRQSVWHALCAIPYGETRTYRDIAREAGNTAAVRAVGGANHANPFIIVVPCHRVIRSDGSIGGYGGGPDVKEYLIRFETAHKK